MPFRSVTSGRGRRCGQGSAGQRQMFPPLDDRDGGNQCGHAFLAHRLAVWNPHELRLEAGMDYVADDGAVGADCDAIRSAPYFRRAPLRDVNADDPLLIAHSQFSLSVLYHNPPIASSSDSYPPGENRGPSSPEIDQPK